MRTNADLASIDCRCDRWSRSGKQDRVDTATRMWLDADLTGRGAMEAPGHEPQTADPIDELRRLIRGRGETQ